MPQETKNILVVEDEWLIADQIAHVLEAAGYKVVGPAANVAAALRLLSDALICAAIVDVNLGKEKSFPVMAALKQRHIPFLISTGYRTSDLPSELSGHPILGKPLEETTILTTLDEVLVSRR